MPISKDEVRYTANLARIKLEDAELEKLALQLEKIIDFIDKLKTLDLGNVEPMSHVLTLANILREDKPAESLKRDEVLKNAPAKEGDFFKVPRVIE